MNCKSTVKDSQNSLEENKDDFDENEDIFEIERIDDHRIIADEERIEFLVKWLGYPDCE